ncbi:MAG: tetratricopeptide repeat protein [Planctomycetes bacterium]|nr:tetratricopeptide repeat protein [Planctomycetota bacterium]
MLAGGLLMWYTPHAPRRWDEGDWAAVSNRARALGAAAVLLLSCAAGCGSAPSPRRAAHALARAKALADRGRTDDALDLLYPLLDTYPDYADAHLLFIRLRGQTGRAVVQKEYEQKVKAQPENALLYFLVGYAAADPAAKGRWLRKAVELDPDLVLAQVELGRLCRTKEALDLAASRQALETAAGLRPDWAEAHLELARTLAAQGRPAEAVAACRRAIELDRACEAAWFELACLLSSEQPAETEKTLAEAVRWCPASGRLWWHLGDFRWARNALREGAGCLERALDISPAAPYASEARTRLAYYYLSRGWHRSALRLGPTPWRDAAAEMADGQLTTEAFRLLHAASQPGAERQVERLQQAARLAPKSAIVRRRLADALFAAGSFAAASAAYGRALAAEPASAELRLRCAEAELLAGRPQSALTILGADRRRISREAAWLAADAEALAAEKVPLEAVAARYAASGLKPDEREKRLRACAGRFPAYLTVRLELARLLAEAGRAADARVELEGAVAIKGHPLAEGLVQEALAEMAISDFGFRISDFNPQSAIANPQWQKAIGHYKAAAARCPEAARIHGALARACAAAGDLVGACEALTRQLVLDPQSYDLAGSLPPGRETGHLLLPRIGQGDVLRYRYSTDGGQPGRDLAWLEFDYAAEAVGAGYVVEGALEIAAVGGRPVEGGKDFVGTRIPVKCSSCFGLAAVGEPAGGVPREFSGVLWLVEFLHGPALPVPRWPGQKWQATAWTDGPGQPRAGNVAFERVEDGKAHLSVEVSHERPAAEAGRGIERATARGRAAVLFSLAQRTVERVELVLTESLTGRRGSRVELPPWSHRVELVRVERGARKAAPPRGP